MGNQIQLQRLQQTTMMTRLYFCLSSVSCVLLVLWIPATIKTEECSDQDSDCHFYVEWEYCDNPFYQQEMASICRKSCGLCGDGCPEDVSFFNGYCVTPHGNGWRDHANYKNFDDADADCRSRGGHLLYIQDTEKWDALKPWISRTFSASIYWFVKVGAKASIPGTGGTPGAEFEWGDGTPMTLPYEWRNDTTSQSYGGDCLQVDPSYKTPLYAGECDSNGACICEYDRA